jgi:CheY-like chemotaxis protein
MFCRRRPNGRLTRAKFDIRFGSRNVFAGPNAAMENFSSLSSRGFPEDEAGLAGVSGKPLVLVVDDDPHEHTFVRTALDDLGIAVTLEAAYSGEEALRKLLPSANDPPACRPKVVLLDLRLPGVDGANVLRVLRATPATSSLPVVVLTGTEDPRVLGEAFRSGADVVLSKTMDMAEYRERLGANIVKYLVEHHDAEKRIAAAEQAARESSHVADPAF